MYWNPSIYLVINYHWGKIKLFPVEFKKFSKESVNIFVYSRRGHFGATANEIQKTLQEVYLAQSDLNSTIKNFIDWTKIFSKSIIAILILIKIISECPRLAFTTKWWFVMIKLDVILMKPKILVKTNKINTANQ